MNGMFSLETSISGKSLPNKFRELGPASATPAHCSVVDKTLTDSSGQTPCK